MFFDTLKDDLKNVSDYFRSVSETDLVTSGADKEKNKTTLADLKAAIFS